MKKCILALTGSIVALSGLTQAQRIATIEIAYTTTTGVHNSVGGTSNSRSLLNTKYDFMRDAEARSVGNINWRISGHFNATYDEQDQTSTTQLNRLFFGSQFNGFRRHRDQQNGDMAQVFCDWTDTGILGLAFRPGWASVCRRPILTINSGTSPSVWTSTHEHGHNMNATHEQGHCMARLNARTIMEPNNGSCSQRPRIGYFSSPTTSVDGRVIGNSSNDNRSVIRAQAPTTAAQQ